MRLRTIQSEKDIIDLVGEVGFLPFFANIIPGFSVEELCVPALWFPETGDGPWEWKGPIARSGSCIYGKFFRHKAGFVSKEWIPDFCNFRRDGYDFDARYDDELALHKDKEVVDTIVAHGTLLSKELKNLCHYRKGGNKGFDTVITRLQMQTYVVISDFVYMQDKFGKTYGWGVAQYSTPESLFGQTYVRSAYVRSPADSQAKIKAHLQKVLPDVPEEKIDGMLMQF